MSVNYNPRTVTDGLVLALDAGNIKSYVGIGSTFTDLSANSNNLTLVNGPTYSSTNGGTLSFNGTNQWAVKSSHSISINGGITMDVWINMNTINPAETESAILNHRSFNYLNLNFIKSSGKFRLEYRSVVSNSSQIFSSQVISASTWYNLVGVVDNSSGARMYLNGVLSASSASAGNLPSTITSNLYIGYDVGFFLPNMRVASVREYNRPLTAAEIQQNFNATRSRYGI